LKGFYTKKHPTRKGFKVIDSSKPLEYIHMLFMIRIPTAINHIKKYPFLILEVTEQALKSSIMDVGSKTIIFGGKDENKTGINVPLHLVTKRSHGATIPYIIGEVKTDPLMKNSFLTICSEQNIESINISSGDGKQIIGMVQDTSTLIQEVV
jgi:hypothetical protein